MKLSPNERNSLGGIQRKCRLCRGWFYVESAGGRCRREINNQMTKQSGCGEFIAPPSVGRICPDCAETTEKPNG